MKNFILFFLLIGLSFNGPLMAAQKDFMIVEGDIAIKRSGDKSSFLRTAILWPGGVIPWMVDGRDADNKKLLDAIKGAMDILNKDTNLVFKKRTDQDKNYLVFTTKENGCFSYVGMQGGAQEVNLSKGCHYNLIAAHEILHAIGMEHEQSREDRDEHIKIVWENIKEKQKHNFGIVKRSNFGEYNLASIMQYGSYSFSKNGQPTMTTIDGEVFEENRKYFTKGDQEAVNNFYSFKFNFDLTKIDLSFKHENEETTVVQLKADPQLIKSIDSVVYKINGGENSVDIATWDSNFSYNFKPLKGRNVINVTFNLKDGTKQEAEFTYFSIDRKISVDCQFSAKRDQLDFKVPITFEGEDPTFESKELGDYFAKASATFNTDSNTMELKMTVGRKPGLIRRERKEEQTFTITETKTQKVESDRAELSCNAINEAL